MVEKMKYSLVAVICHCGERANSGHYISYHKFESTQWVFCNDKIIQLLTEVEAMSSIKDESAKFTPYLLLYERIDLRLTNCFEGTLSHIIYR
jgi:hypothetical protein